MCHKCYFRFSLELVSGDLYFGNEVRTLIDLLLARKEAWINRPNLVNFAKENIGMTPVLRRNTASCDDKLLRILEHFSES